MHKMKNNNSGMAEELFEIILYYCNKSWAFSTYKIAQSAQVALERAEKYFLLHLASLHSSGPRETAYAYVIGNASACWYAKHSGAWEPARLAFDMPLPPPVGASGRHALALAL
jgi:hypothetical protein